MRRAIFLILFCWLGTTVTLAQDAASGAAASNAQAQSAPLTAPQDNTIRGCLSGSTGNFTLTDPNGTQYRLVGNDSALQSEVSHEVELSGTQTQSLDTSNGSGADSVQSADSFQVSGIKNISNDCGTKHDSGTASPRPESGGKNEPSNPPQ